jgi:mannose-6-phosphate isomerase-like protein (cupin superfamily)
MGRSGGTCPFANEERACDMSQTKDRIPDAVSTGYTIQNLKEIEDSAPKFGLAPNVEAHFATRDLECEKTGISYQRLAPGARGPFGHKHEEQEEIYVILSGSGKVKLGDDEHELKPFDAVRVSADTIRAFEAGPDGLELFAFGAPRVSEPDVEMIQGWWGGDG